MICVAAGCDLACTSTSPHLTTSATTEAPTITTAPVAMSVTEGQSGTFMVAAAGSTPLHYQWQDNGVDVGTDSATYTLLLPKTSNSGDSITVTVANTGGSVTSSAVSLTVNPLLVTLAGSMPLKLTPIAAGTYTMGMPTSDSDDTDDMPQHQVTISENFYMGTYPVTQAQWQQVTGSNPSNFSVAGGGSVTDDLQRPVEGVSYTDITTASTGFLALLNAEMATICPLCPSGYVFRLPTEAEWEYACRAGKTTRFYWGNYSDSDTTINGYAWYRGNAGSTTHPVGGLAANAWGLYDMAGNVAEWCQDWYGTYDSGPDTDPAGPANGSYRTLRGGDWADINFYCLSAARGCTLPGSSFAVLGFRVVLAPPRTS